MTYSPIAVCCMMFCCNCSAINKANNSFLQGFDFQMILLVLPNFDFDCVVVLSRVGFLPAETCFCQTCGLNRIKVVKTMTRGKNLDLPYLMMQTLYHTHDSLTSA